MSTDSTENLIRSIIQRIAVGPDRGKDISEEEAYLACQALLNDQLEPIHAALFLIGLRMKRESIEEYCGIFRALQEPVSSKQLSLAQLVYLADPYDGYARHLPMSPFVPAVLAACGMPCLIQGVESVGPKFGITAHQVYAAYGMNSTADIDSVSQALLDSDCSWAYLDQSQTQTQLHALRGFRDQIVKRTALTTLERLIKPITAEQTYLTIGYVHKAYPEIYAKIAQQAGFDKTLLIKGLEGGVTPAMNKPLRSFFASLHHVDEKIVDTAPLENYPAAGLLINTEETQQKSLAEQTLMVGLDALAGQPGIAYDVLLHTSATILSKLQAEQQNSDLATQSNRQATLRQVNEVLQSGLALKHFQSFKITRA